MHIFAFDSERIYINLASTATVAAPATAAAASIFQINKGTLKSTCFGNLQQQGNKNSNHNSFDFFSGFQDDVEFVHTVDFLDANFGADFTYGDAFDFDSISSGSFEYDNVSCEFSVEHRQCRRQKKCRTNWVFLVENVKKSCWYRYFTRRGLT